MKVIKQLFLKLILNKSEIQTLDDCLDCKLESIRVSIIEKTYSQSYNLSSEINEILHLKKVINNKPTRH